MTRKSKKHVVLLAGICDAGKTVMFSSLVYGKISTTFSSIKENIGTFQANTSKKVKSLKLIDIPGHEKLRQHYLKQYRDSAGAIVFVVDSEAIMSEIKEVAEYLYTFLTDATMVKSGVHVLIACNKQDQTLAKGLKVVRNLLEKELDTLRVTRAGALAGLDPSEVKNSVPLVRKGQTFHFADCRLPVDFVECSSKDNLAPVKLWMETL